MHTRQGMDKWLQRHPEMDARVGRAKASKILKHIRNLDRISVTDDVRGYNAAVKASEIILSANDERFKKVKDNTGPGGFGVIINVTSGIPSPEITTFEQHGGVIDDAAVEAIESRADERIELPERPERPEAPMVPASQDVGVDSGRQGPKPPQDAVVESGGGGVPAGESGGGDSDDGGVGGGSEWF